MAASPPQAYGQAAAVAAGWFLGTSDQWADKYFDPNDLHYLDRRLFGEQPAVAVAGATPATARLRVVRSRRRLAATSRDASLGWRTRFHSPPAR